MNIINSTKKYEKWLSSHIELEPRALEKKHSEMARDPFRFLRATFYHWGQVWPKQCKAMYQAPQVLGIGDLHVENFGTWRDVEGRLVWGVNDLDEAAMMPYTNDLVRLATSAKLAIDQGALQISFSKACKEILEGYENTIGHYLHGGKEGLRPVVLAERNEWLSGLAQSQSGDPDDFWDKFLNPEKVRLIEEEDVPPDVREALRKVLPGDPEEHRFISWNRRDAGLGSLGRRRFLVTAEWRGGKVAREAKELCPSAWHWANGQDSSDIHYESLLTVAVRSPDPCVSVLYCPGDEQAFWFVRRLSPDCSKIELDLVPDKKEDDLFRAMGRETANIHVGSGEAAIRHVHHDLKQRDKKWLKKAATDMAAHMVDDWKVWKAHNQKSK